MVGTVVASLAGIVSRRAVQAPIHFPVAHDGFNIFARLRKRDRLDKFRQASVGTVREPGLHAIIAALYAASAYSGCPLNSSISCRKYTVPSFRFTCGISKNSVR